ncbi:hypothetical protein HK099_006717 [Clydaea vesicula]|uniref:Uncharacterized protein n=1 Tax=Clydaea vesicula TaxID=447962 RepID=A0AAD5Y1Y3_9FUNG|nr:hypothetical protein HK099_006717 [Clydaea vesicula]
MLEETFKSNLKDLKSLDSTEFLEEEDDSGDENKQILSWKSVKKAISLNIPKSYISPQHLNYKQVQQNNLQNPVSSTKNLPREKNTKKKEAALNSQQVATQPITIPHGFQLQKQITKISNYPLKKVIFWDNLVDTFSALDAKTCTIIRGSTKVATYSTAYHDNSNEESNSCAGLIAWVFVPKWRALIIATTHLELKILDSNMETKSSTSSSKPVLSLEFVNSCEELIVGCVNSIRIYTFKKIALRGRFIQVFTGTRIVINDFSGEEWITKTLLHESTGRLYASCENHVYIYDYENGERLSSMKNIHVLSITSLLYCEGAQYLITGSKDGTVKVWNNSGYLMHTLKSHSNAVTSLLNQPNLNTTLNQIFILSASLDGSICLWNIDLGVLINKLETQNECVGMELYKKDSFFFYSKSDIFIYNITRAYQSYSAIRSNVVQISRCDNGLVPARILAAGLDGSLRLISPVTGSVLIIGYPVIEDVEPVSATYNQNTGLKKVRNILILNLDMIWLLLKNGDVAIYDTSSNPMNVTEQWFNENSPGEKCTHLVMYEFSNPKYVERFGETYPLFGGTESGQIVLFSDAGVQERLVQAHTAKITTLVINSRRNQIISGGRDNCIKIWSIKFNEKSLENDNSGYYGCLFLLDVLVVIPIIETSTRMAFNSLSNDAMLLGIVTEHYKTVMIRINGDHTFKYLDDHASDENHVREVTGIAGNSTLNIFVTSSSDGTIKIWDGIENSLMREVQFNEAPSTVEFANERGDIMIGVGDEICLVRIQDYLPYNLQQYILDLNFEDDELEFSIMFDPSLDFWSFYRKILEEGGIELENWHIEKSEIPHDLVSMKTITKHEMKLRKLAMMQRRTKRLFLARERNIFEIAKEFEDTAKFSETVFELHLESKKKKKMQFAEDDENVDTFDYDFELFSKYGKRSKRISQNDDDKIHSDLVNNEQILESLKTQINTKKKTKAEEIVENFYLRRRNKNARPVIKNFLEKKTAYFLPPIIIRSQDEEHLETDMNAKKYLLLDRAKDLEMSGEDVQKRIELEKKLLEKPKVDVVIKRQQKMMLRKMYGGREFSNSRVSQSIEADPRKSKVTKNKPLHVENNEGYTKGKLSKALLDKVKQRREELLLKEMASKTNKTNKINDAVLESGTEKEKEASTLLTEEDDFLLERFKENGENLKSNSDMSENCLTNHIKTSVFHDTYSSDEHNAKKAEVKYRSSTVRESVLHKHKKFVPNSKSDTDSDNETVISSLDSYESSDGETERRENEIKRKVMNEKLQEEERLSNIQKAKEEREKKELEKIREKKLADKATLEKLKDRDKELKMKREKHLESLRKKLINTPVFSKKETLPVVKNVEKDITILDIVSKTLEEPVKNKNRPRAPSICQKVDIKPNKVLFSGEYLEAEKKTWGLLKSIIVNNSEAEVVNKSKLSKIESLAKDFETKVWFPGMGGREINLENIVDVLLIVLDTGYWREKIEAATAVRSIYYTFKEDFKNPKQTILNPLIDHLDDDSPKVRFVDT